MKPRSSYTWHMHAAHAADISIKGRTFGIDSFAGKLPPSPPFVVVTVPGSLFLHNERAFGSNQRTRNVIYQGVNELSLFLCVWHHFNFYSIYIFHHHGQAGWYGPGAKQSVSEEKNNARGWMESDRAGVCRNKEALAVWSNHKWTSHCTGHTCQGGKTHLFADWKFNGYF